MRSLREGCGKARSAGRALVAIGALSVVSTAALVPPATGIEPGQPGRELRSVKVWEAGISIEYPRSWSKTELSTDALEEVVEQLSADNPEFADALNEQTREFVAQNAELLLVEIATGASLLVIVGPGWLFPSDFDEFESDIRTVYRESGIDFVSAEQVEIGKKSAFRTTGTQALTMPSGEAVTARVEELYLHRGDELVNVTVSTSDDRDGERLAERIVASVEPLGGSR